MRLEELNGQLSQNHASIKETRISLESLAQDVQHLDEKMKIATDEFSNAENEFNQANGLFNENNLLLARQQSKVNSLKQEFEFKNNQFNDLSAQRESSDLQMKDASLNIAGTTEELKIVEDTLL